MRNTLLPSTTGLMGQWIFSGLHTCTLMAGHMAICGFITGAYQERVHFFSLSDRNVISFPPPPPPPPLRLNVLTIFQVFKNRNCCVAMAPCATPEQFFFPL